MPLDNNGNYSRPGGKTAWQDDRDEDIPILASRHDEDGEDMAEAISQMLPKDGRAAMQGSLNMGGSKIQNLSDAAQAQDAVLWYIDNGQIRALMSTKANNTDNFNTTPSVIGTSWVDVAPTKAYVDNLVQTTAAQRGVSPVLGAGKFRSAPTAIKR